MSKVRGISALIVKKQIVSDIMAAVNESGKIERDKIIARLSLDSGFKSATIKETISNMEILGYICVTDRFIFTPNKYDEYILGLQKEIKEELGK